MPPKQTISKTRFVAGAQCARRFWLESMRPELAAPPDRATQEKFARGTRYGELARERYPGGKLISGMQLESARRATDEALSDVFLPAIFEAAIAHEDVVIRADILDRAGVGEWDLLEVKSARSPREVFEIDLALQYWVVRGAGIRVRRAGLLLLSGDHGDTLDDPDPDRAFVFHDLTDRCKARLVEISERVAFLKEMFAAPGEPDVSMGAHCHAPYDCPFIGHCSR